MCRPSRYTPRMPEIVTITYENESDDFTSDFLVFSHYVSQSVHAESKAWQVIQHIGPGDSHVFRYTVASQLRCVWDDGESVSNLVDSWPGQGWQFTTIGNDYQLVSDANVKIDPAQIGVLNSVPDTVTVQLLKDGGVWASQASVANGQLAAFEFQPTIYVGFGRAPVTSLYVDAAVMSAAWTEVSLFSLSSLTIVAKGTAATGYEFIVRDIVQEEA